MIGIESIKVLREKTKSSYFDCKNALIQANGNIEEAENIIRNKGHEIIERKTVDISTNGMVYSYIHPGNRIGVLVEVKCSTDFVAKTDEFKEFTKNISLQIASMKPKFISRADVPLEIISEEVAFRIERLKNDGMKEDDENFQKLLDSEMELWFSEICLLEQTYIKDNKKRVQDLLAELISKVGEACRISRFNRWELGVEYGKNEIIEEKEEKHTNLAREMFVFALAILFAFFLTQAGCNIILNILGA